MFFPCFSGCVEVSVFCSTAKFINLSSLLHPGTRLAAFLTEGPKVVNFNCRKMQSGVVVLMEM